MFDRKSKRMRLIVEEYLRATEFALELAEKCNLEESILRERSQKDMLEDILKHFDEIK